VNILKKFFIGEKHIKYASFVVLDLQLDHQLFADFCIIVRGVFYGKQAF
jgi:hypothetical protein